MTKIVSLILLIGSITFGLLMIFGTSKLNEQNDEATLKIYSETLSQKHNDPQDFISTFSESNITEEFIDKASEKIAGEIIAMNPDGLQTIEGEQWLNAPNPEALADKIFEEKITNFDVSQLKGVVKIADLKIVPNSELPAKTYAQNLQNTLSTNLFIIPEQPSQKDMNKLLASYKKVLPLLYDVEVPESAASIHQQGIAVLETNKNILEKLLDTDNDPLGAIIVINLLPEAYQNTADFAKKINELINS